MKRVYILLLACMGAMSVMAQGQKLKNRIIDKDYYPVDSAKVTVKGTNISTFTDKNGNFVLEDVPLILDSIQIQKGKKDYSVSTPVKVAMRKAVMDHFSWVVKAGYEFPMYEFDEFDVVSGSSMFYVGVGIDAKMSRHVAFQPGINLSIRKMNGEGEYDEYDGYGYSYGPQTYNAGVLEIPLLFAFKFPVGYSANLVFKVGPYIDLGLWGKIKYTPDYVSGSDNYNYEEREFDVYGKRIGGGAAYGLGIEFGRFMVGITGHTGWSPNERSYDEGFGYTSYGVEFNYRF